jgi:hypothetical protein
MITKKTMPNKTTKPINPTSRGARTDTIQMILIVTHGEFADSIVLVGTSLKNIMIMTHGGGTHLPTPPRLLSFTRVLVGVGEILTGTGGGITVPRVPTGMVTIALTGKDTMMPIMDGDTITHTIHLTVTHGPILTITTPPITTPLPQVITPDQLLPGVLPQPLALHGIAQGAPGPIRTLPQQIIKALQATTQIPAIRDDPHSNAQTKQAQHQDNLIPVPIAQVKGFHLHIVRHQVRATLPQGHLHLLNLLLLLAVDLVKSKNI